MASSTRAPMNIIHSDGIRCETQQGLLKSVEINSTNHPMMLPFRHQGVYLNLSTRVMLRGRRSNVLGLHLIDGANLAPKWIGTAPMNFWRRILVVSTQELLMRQRVQLIQLLIMMIAWMILKLVLVEFVGAPLIVHLVWWKTVPFFSERRAPMTGQSDGIKRTLWLLWHSNAIISSKPLGVIWYLSVICYFICYLTWYAKYGPWDDYFPE